MQNITAVNSHKALRAKMRVNALLWRKYTHRARYEKALKDAISFRDAAAEFYANWIKPIDEVVTQAAQDLGLPIE